MVFNLQFTKSLLTFKKKSMKKLFMFSFLILFVSSSSLYSQDNIDLDLSRKEKSKSQLETKDFIKNTSNIPASRNNMHLPNTDATSLIAAIPNDGGSSQNGRAPMGGRRFIRTVYLIKPSEMAAFGTGGDLITHIAWEYLTNNLNFGQNIPTKCDSLKIWFQNTTDVTNTKSTSWATAVTGMTLVYNGNYVLPSGEFGQFGTVNLGGTGTSPFTSAAGNGLYVAFEYTNNAPGRIAALTSSANITCNYQGLVSGCLTGQSQISHAATMGASSFRPVTYLGKGSPADVFVDVANVAGIYLPNQSLICPCPDTNKLSVVVDHLRFGVIDTLFVNTRVLNLNGGAVKEEWNDMIITNDSVRNYYLYHNYLKDGDTKKVDSIVVTIDTILGENVLYNNAAYTLKYSTLNTVSYFDNINLFAFGGVGPGLNGEIAARFQTSCPIKLCAVQHGFLSATSNVPYQIKIYSGGNGSGNLVYTSPPLLSGPNVSPAVEKDTIHYLTSPVTIPAGDYYVSMVQTSATNPGFAYYGESPIRQNVYYFWNGTVWTEFSSVPTNAFNVKIIPHTTLQLQISMWLEGFFNGTSMTGDTIKAIARSLSTLEPIDTAIAYVGSTGIGNFDFCKLNNDSCYIYQLRHRNHIQTWSHQACEMIDICGKNYNFQSNITSAYGNNMIFITADNSGAGGYGFYTSDVNQDDVVDGADCSDIDNDASNFASGYLVTDVNGDEAVEGVDLAYCDNNSSNFIAAAIPSP